MITSLIHQQRLSAGASYDANRHPAGKLSHARNIVIAGQEVISYAVVSELLKNHVVDEHMWSVRRIGAILQILHPPVPQ